MVTTAYMEDMKDGWISAEKYLPEFGRTVVADDNTLAWLDRQAGWLKFDHENQWHSPRSAPTRWRYLQVTHAAAQE